MNKAKHLIIAKNAPQSVKQRLKMLGYTLIESCDIDSVQEPLRYHPDMQIVQCGDRWICAPGCYEYYKPYFEKLDIPLIAGDTCPAEKYPLDVAYNIVVTGKYAIHNFEYTDTLFTSLSPYEHINVKQGYSKCSVCIVSDSAVITSDQGIASVLNRHGIDVLRISTGNVTLEGYDYGFIGGASGMANGTVMFSGDVYRHPDGEAICSFCRKHGMEPVSLGRGELVDIGTIVALA